MLVVYRLSNWILWTMICYDFACVFPFGLSFVGGDYYVSVSMANKVCMFRMFSELFYNDTSFITLSAHTKTD